MPSFSGIDLNSTIDYQDDYISNSTDDDLSRCPKGCFNGNIIGFMVFASLLALVGITGCSKICCNCIPCLIPCYTADCIRNTCNSFFEIYNLYKERKKLKKENENYIFNYLNSLEKTKSFNEDCPICIEKIDKNNITLPCGHSFHMDCIHVWLKEGDSMVCPVCRKDVFIPIPVPSRKVVDYSSDSDISYDEY